MAQTPTGARKTAAKHLGITLEAYALKEAAGMKWCRVCRDWRQVSCFGRDATRFDGLATTCLAHRRVAVRKTTKGRASTFKGHHHTPEARAKLSRARKGQPSNHKGVRHNAETRARISAVVRERAVRGAACRSYKDGRCAERREGRRNIEYKRWRYDVYARDGFCCQRCGDARGGNLAAHHVKPFADFPTLRHVVSNGITLCRKCHKAEHAKNAA